VKSIKYIFLFSFILSYSALFSQHLEPVWVKHWGNTSYGIIGKNFFHKGIQSNITISAYLHQEQIDTFDIKGCILAQFSPNGDLIWLSKLDTNIDFIYSFKTCNPSKNIYTLSSKGYGNKFYRIYELAKYDSMAQKIWTRHFKFLETLMFPEEGLFGIEVNKNDDVFIGWHLKDAHLIIPEGDTIPRENVYHIFKYDSAGTLVGDYTPFGLDYRVVDFATDNYNNNIHLIQSNFLGSGIITYEPSYNNIFCGNQVNNYAERIFVNGQNDVFVTSNSGNIYDLILCKHRLQTYYGIGWCKDFKGFAETFPHPNNPSINIHYKTTFGTAKVSFRNDDVYIFSSFTHKMEIDGHVFNAIENGKLSFFITKFDKNGNYQWTELFQTKHNSTNYFNNTDIIFDENGDLYAAIMFENEIHIDNTIYQSQGNYNIIFMKLEETGVGLKPIQENNAFSFELYPNPANDIVNIEISTDENFLTGKLKIYNFLGTKVYERPVRLEKGNDNISFNISHLPQGLYFVSLEMPSQKAVKKLVKY